MPYGSSLQSLWARAELEGKCFSSENSHLHKTIATLAFEFISICVNEKRRSLSACLYLDVGIRWAHHRIDFHPLAVVCLFVLPYVNSPTHTCTLLQYWDLISPEEPTLLPRSLSLQELRPLRSHHHSHDNQIRNENKWHSELRRQLAEQRFVPGNRKPLHVALGCFNNSLRCVDTAVPVSCGCADFLSACKEEIRTRITEESYLRGGWIGRAEKDKLGSTTCPTITTPHKETWEWTRGAPLWNRVWQDVIKGDRSANPKWYHQKIQLKMKRKKSAFKMPEADPGSHPLPSPDHPRL